LFAKEKIAEEKTASKEAAKQGTNLEERTFTHGKQNPRMDSCCQESELSSHAHG